MKLIVIQTRLFIKLKTEYLKFCKVNEFDNAWSALISDIRNKGLKWGEVLPTAEDNTKIKR